MPHFGIALRCCTDTKLGCIYQFYTFCSCSTFTSEPCLSCCRIPDATSSRQENNLSVMLDSTSPTPGLHCPGYRTELPRYRASGPGLLMVDVTASASPISKTTPYTIRVRPIIFHRHAPPHLGNKETLAKRTTPSHNPLQIWPLSLHSFARGHHIPIESNAHLIAHNYAALRTSIRPYYLDICRIFRSRGGVQTPVSQSGVGAGVGALSYWSDGSSPVAETFAAGAIIALWPSSCSSPPTSSSAAHSRHPIKPI